MAVVVLSCVKVRAVLTQRKWADGSRETLGARFSAAVSVSRSRDGRGDDVNNTAPGLRSRFAAAASVSRSQRRGHGKTKATPLYEEAVLVSANAWKPSNTRSSSITQGLRSVSRQSANVNEE